jgi:hypothetical protein
MSVRYLQERKNEGALLVCSKKLYDLAMQLETAFYAQYLTTQSWTWTEAICHDVLLNKLPDIGCVLHRNDCIANVIEDYLSIRFTCIAKQGKLLRTTKISLESQTKRKQAKFLT